MLPQSWLASLVDEAVREVVGRRASALRHSMFWSTTAERLAVDGMALEFVSMRWRRGARALGWSLVLALVCRARVGGDERRSREVDGHFTVASLRVNPTIRDGGWIGRAECRS